MPEEEATIIYHYTSEEGMRGIVESDRIWATDIGFLNDYTEFRQAFKEEYVGALTDAFREGLPKDLYDTARVVIEGILSKRISNILKIIQDSISTHQAFVCSFTTLPRPSGADPGDRLSQWRGYSRSSQGLSLGFNKTLLTKQIEFDNGYSKAVLLECIYEDKETFFFFQTMGREAAMRFKDRWLRNEPVPDWFQTLIPNPTEEYKKTQVYFLKSLSEATAEFFTKAARLKHSGFREECEWRIVFYARRDALAPDFVRLRNGQFGQTPFIEIPLALAKPEKSSLQRIVVGPSDHKEDIKHSVELLLRKHGINGVEVATSLIPYRSA